MRAKCWIRLFMKTTLAVVLLARVCFPVACAQGQPTEPKRYYTSTARAQHLIDSVFPYDIRMMTMTSDTVLSKDALKNDKPLVMLFWLTTCGPCRAELEAFRVQYDSMQAVVPFRFVAISTDFADKEATIKQRAAKWPWPTYWDYNREFGLIMPGRLNGLPQLFVFDSAGQLRYHKRKYQTGDEWQVIEALRKL